MLNRFLAPFLIATVEMVELVLWLAASISWGALVIISCGLAVTALDMGEMTLLAIAVAAFVVAVPLYRASGKLYDCVISDRFESFMKARIAPAPAARVSLPYADLYR